MTTALNLSLTSFKCREQNLNAMHNMKFDIDFGKNQKAGNIQGCYLIFDSHDI